MFGKQKLHTQRNVLIVGATSSLAQELAQQMAERGWNIVLCGRDREELNVLAHDITLRHSVLTRVIVADLADPEYQAERAIYEAESMAEIDLLIVTAGDMPLDRPPHEDALMERMIRVNYTAPAKIMEAMARLMEKRGQKGDIVVISSVAGDRGRAKNYVYGSAKAAISTFASGMRNRLAKKKIHVMTVKPGFVDTPMTYGMDSKLMASRKDVAANIISAIDKRKDILYVPAKWALIMLIIRNIPEAIFKKLDL